LRDIINEVLIEHVGVVAVTIIEEIERGLAENAAAFSGTGLTRAIHDIASRHSAQQAARDY
jgi:hypothetical protein